MDTTFITVTDAAAKKIQRYIDRRGNGVGIKVGVRTTGCSGLAYTLEYVDQLDSNDQLFEDKGIKVFISPAHIPYLSGMEIDYKRQGLNEGFEFSNPQARDHCGCGESFRV
jgi:iron-sulfur cluster assembly protein